MQCNVFSYCPQHTHTEEDYIKTQASTCERITQRIWFYFSRSRVQRSQTDKQLQQPDAQKTHPATKNERIETARLCDKSQIDFVLDSFNGVLRFLMHRV